MKRYPLGQFQLILVDRVFWFRQVADDEEDETKFDKRTDGIILVGGTDVAESDFGSRDTH